MRTCLIVFWLLNLILNAHPKPNRADKMQRKVHNTIRIGEDVWFFGCYKTDATNRSEYWQMSQLVWTRF